MGIPALLNDSWPAVEVYLSSWTRGYCAAQSWDLLPAEPQLNKAAEGS